MVLVLKTSLRSTLYIINVFLKLNLQIIFYFDFFSYKKKFKKYAHQMSLTIAALIKLLSHYKFYYIDTVDPGYFMNDDIIQNFSLNRKNLSLFIFLNFDSTNEKHLNLLDELKLLNFYVIIFTKNPVNYLNTYATSVCKMDLNNIFNYYYFLFLFKELVNLYHFNYIYYINFKFLTVYSFYFFFKLNFKKILKSFYFFNFKKIKIKNRIKNFNLNFYKKKFFKFNTEVIKSYINIQDITDIKLMKILILKIKKLIDKFNIFYFLIFKKKIKYRNFFLSSELGFNFVKHFYDQK